MALHAKLSVVGWRAQPISRDKSMRRMTIILFLREISEFGLPLNYSWNFHKTSRKFFTEL